MGLISIYLVGEDKSTNNVPAITESTISLALMSTLSIPTTAKFLLLDKFWATSKLKSIGASEHPDKAVCPFSLLILHMSARSESLLNHIANCLRAQTTINNIGSGRNDGCGSGGGGVGGYDNGDSNGDRDGNDNGDGNRYGNADSGNSNGNAGDSVDGDDGDGGDNGIGGSSGGSGDGCGGDCGNALGRLPSVNDATFITTMFLTRPTTSMHCQASARGRPPTADLI